MSAPPTPTADGYCAVRCLTEALAEPLSAEDQTVQSMPDVSPTKWHRAHVTWFFETFVLGPSVPGYEPFDPDFAFLFNSYYEAAGPRHARPERGLLTRPGIVEVAAYRAHVDAAMVDALAAGLDEATLALVELGLHHEQQHQELLLMDIAHVLSRHPFGPAYLADPCPVTGAARPQGWLAHDGGPVEIGHDGDGFAFDNEGGRHTVWLAPFALADRPVTNGEFLAFVEDDGYRRPDLWLSEGWAGVLGSGASAPLYWHRDDDGRWWEFGLAGEEPLDPARPVVHLSYFEADAYARWAGVRLPTEAEWEAVAADRPADGHELTSGVLRPRPTPPGATALIGEVWEWTASAYLPYPAFRTAPGAVGEYNGKFMVNQHVLRGGCCATPTGHTRVTYRNFFPASSQWAFSGLRLATDEHQARCP